MGFNNNHGILITHMVSDTSIGDPEQFPSNITITLEIAFHGGHAVKTPVDFAMVNSRLVGGGASDVGN